MDDTEQQPDKFCGMTLTRNAHPRHRWGPDGGKYTCPGERRRDGAIKREEQDA